MSSRAAAEHDELRQVCLLRYLSQQQRCCSTTVSRLIITPVSAEGLQPKGLVEDGS